jgi:hypothetical protein
LALGLRFLLGALLLALLLRAQCWARRGFLLLAFFSCNAMSACS